MSMTETLTRSYKRIEVKDCSAVWREGRWETSDSSFALYCAHVVTRLSSFREFGYYGGVSVLGKGTV